MRWRTAILCLCVMLMAAACGAEPEPQRFSFSDPVGPVSIAFPGAATLQDVEPSGRDLGGQMYEQILRDEHYMFWQVEHGETADAATVLTTYRNNAMEDHPNIALINEAQVENNGYPGIEMYFDYDHNNKRVRETLRYYVAGGQTYILLYAGADGKYNADAAARFFDSFRVGE